MINKYCGHRRTVEGCDQCRIAELEVENQRLRDPDWKTYITITEKWLEKYPPDIFTGVSGDLGPLFVVAIRNALAALQEQGDG